jgi:hypothetical protein
MCTPLAIAGVALSAGSAVANAAAASKAASARNDALAAERIRQQGYDRETDALNLQSQDRYKDFEGQQDEKAATLGDYFAGQQTTEPTPAAALPTSQSTVTVQEEGKQRGIARDFTDKAGQALGDLRAFGDLLGGIGRLQARDASQIGQIGGFKRGSSNVLPIELDAASQQGGGLRTLGDILGGVGSAATSFGLGGGSLSGLFGGGGSTVTNAVAKADKLPIGNPRASTSNLRLGSLYGGPR